MPRFNLIEEAWIPVRKGSVVKEVSLREALVHAYQYERLEDPSPLVEVALLRVLLAVLHRALEGPENEDALFDLFDAGRFPRDRIEAYLERFYDRFWLIHDVTPFWQVADLPSGEKSTPISKLNPMQASGDNPTLFNHSFDDDQQVVGFAEAARLLCSHQTFAPGGTLSGNRDFFKVTSGKDAPLARSAVFVPQGANLFETLAYLLPPYRGDGDSPTWEEPPLRAEELIAGEDGSPKRRLPLIGRTRVYTWPSRGILFLPEGEEVRYVAYGPGIHPLDPERYHDPFTAVEVDAKKKTLRVTRLRKNRGFWRDFGALFPEPGQGAPPQVLETARALASRTGRRKRRPVPLMVTGQVTKPGMDKVLEIRRELFPLPTKALPRILSGYIRNALKVTEAHAKCLEKALKDTSKELIAMNDDEKVKKKRGKNERSGKERSSRLLNSLPGLPYYYHRLGILFLNFLENLDDDLENALQQWQSVVLSTTQDAWAITRQQAGTQSRTLKALQKGERTLTICLRKEKKNA